jgi:branched-chain amino acid transport system substrate-binding protein
MIYLDAKLNKRIIPLLTIFLVALLVLVFFFAFDLTGNVITNDKPIQVGAILPLSGSMAYLGEEVRNALTLAEEDINSKNNKKIELIFEDSKMDPKEAISSANKLILVNHVKYVYVFSTPIINAVKPITEQNKVVLIGASLSSSILKDTNYTTRIHLNTDQSIDLLIKFMKSKNMKNIAVLSQNSEVFSSQLSKLSNEGIDIIANEVFNQGDNDFRTQLIKIKEEKPEFLIILGYGSHFPILFKQLKELDMNNIRILGGMDFLDAPKDTLSLYDEAIFTVPTFNLYLNKQTKDFANEYKLRFNSKPTQQAAYAYDNLQILYEAITNTNGRAKEVTDYVKGMKNYKGVAGEIVLLPNGDSKGDISLATYDGGNLQEYKS